MAKNKHHATANPKPIAVAAAPAKPKYSRKKILLLAAIAVVLVGLIVLLCLPNKADAPLTEEQMNQISQDWLQHYSWVWYDEGHVNGCRYYGEFDGYQIVFRPYSSMEPLEVYIANQRFYCENEFNIYGYKDNKLTELSDLYDAGYVSQDNIIAIAAVHNGDRNSWPTLDEDTKALVETLWHAQNTELNWDSGEYLKRSTRYYGTYEGYIFFLNVSAVPPHSLSYYRYVIAGSTFEMSCSATFYGYKDGRFFRMRDLYDDGIISEKTVAAIAEKHANGI